MTIRWPGDRLRALRIARGMSVQALGSVAGVHASSISNYENGREPTLTCGVSLAHALGVPIEDLLEIHERNRAPSLRRGVIVSMAPGPVALDEAGQLRRLNGPWRVQKTSGRILFIASARQGLRTPQVFPMTAKRIAARARTAGGAVHLTLSVQPTLHPSGEWTFELAPAQAGPDTGKA